MTASENNDADSDLRLPGSVARWERGLNEVLAVFFWLCLSFYVDFLARRGTCFLITEGD